MTTVQDMIGKYSRKMQAVDWSAAAAEWNASKVRAAQNYAAISGINPRVAAKHNAGVQAGVYRTPDVQRAIRNYTGKMSGSSG